MFVQEKPKTPAGRRKDISKAPGVDATPGSTPATAPHAGEKEPSALPDPNIASNDDSLPTTPPEKIIPGYYVALVRLDACPYDGCRA